ncbi:MAG: hypothetical protein HFG51_13520 [Lachnospiraceae bacterium]|nr:hypothetical protein [Lachnospiraceae bacterium]
MNNIFGLYRAVIRADSKKAISNARFSKSFIGLDGIDICDGLMTWDIETARIDHLTIKRSDQIYLLTDSSKFKKRHPCHRFWRFPSFSFLLLSFKAFNNKNDQWQNSNQFPESPLPSPAAAYAPHTL